VLEKALRLDQENTKLGTAYAAFAKQAKLAAQQGQIREMLDNAGKRFHHGTLHRRLRFCAR
jgi:hypothetical protein